MKKHYNYLDIDLDSSKIYRKLSAMQGDIKSRYILVNLYSNNLAYDLTNCNVKIYGIKKDTTVFFNNAVIIDALKGQFEIELTNQALAVSGELKIQILILGATGEKLTSSAFFINVGESIVDENAIESTNEFNALTEGLAGLVEYDIYKQNVSAHEEKLNDHDAQFNTIAIEKVDKEELNALGQLKLEDTYDTFTALQTALPNGATGLYLVIADGFTYRWSGSAWIQAVQFQSNGIADGSITQKKTDFFIFSKNLFNKNTITIGKFILKSGEISSDYPNAFISERIEIKANINYAIPQEFYGSRIRLEDKDGNLLSMLSEDNLPSSNCVFSFSQNCFAIFSQLSRTNIDTYMVTQSDTPISNVNYIPYFNPYIKKECVENLDNVVNDVDSLKNDVTEIKENSSMMDDKVIGYGDSLTAGTGGNGTTYLTVLQNLLVTNENTLTVVNRGGGGETCNGINSRIGAFPIILNPFTLPADTSKVVVTTKLVGSETVNDLNRFMRGVNPCYVDGIECTLSRVSDTDKTLYLNRNVAGASVTFDRPQQLITDGYLHDRNAKIFVIWMGTNNDTYTAEQIIQKQRLFVDTIKTDKYIILGITQDNEPNRVTHNNAMAQEWGSHFLDIREYIIEYGLQDMGITPTTADTDAIALGKIPTSLLYDDTHFNEFGYTVIGQQLYKLGKKLGYWN